MIEIVTNEINLYQKNVKHVSITHVSVIWIISKIIDAELLKTARTAGTHPSPQVFFFIINIMSWLLILPGCKIKKCSLQ